MRLSYTWLSLLIIGISGYLSCSPSIRPPSHVIPSPPMEDFAPPVSNINAQIYIHKHSLQDTVATILDSVLADAIELPEQEMQIFLKRIDPITIDAQQKNILLKLPLSIVVLKKTLLGLLTANGEIEMTFESAIDIDSTWRLSTNTTLADHEWINKPQLSLGWIKIPIKRVSDVILDRSRSQIASSIDSSIHQNMDLPQQIQYITSHMLTPYQLDSTVGGWLTPICPQVALSPMTNEENYISSRLRLPMTLAVRAEQTEMDSSQMPSFSWDDMPEDTSTIHIGVDLTYDYLERLGRQRFVGQTYEQGGRSVTIQDISVSDAGGRVRVDVQTTGSYKGTLSLACTPRYEDSYIRAHDIEWALHTKNILHRTASWLAKGYIHDRIEDMLTFDMNEYMTQAKEEISAQLTQIKESQNIDTRIEWHHLDLSEVTTHTGGIQAMLTARISLSIDLNDLKTLAIPKN